MHGGIFWLGLLASCLTSLSYWPQLRKALRRGATKDLSIRTLAILTVGLLCWIAYGYLQKDWIIVIANIVGASLAAVTLSCKIRDLRAQA
jgi:MtN3 and saliva related transmembrane protein